ncbi:MAG: DUF2071 domain-containing protein [Flavobacteriaceae bacterium]|nr:DUF2071 domain-containing protein [Flavobacteriaceae bacterium]
MSFLTAEWRKLILINYNIDPEILAPYVPNGTELDFYNNTCYVSIVGFLFQETKLLGIKIPFHSNFEEVNLRFYVRHKENNHWKRGVVFIKELVPKPALTLVANSIYKENYQTVPMQHTWESNPDSQKVEYKWVIKNKAQKINIISQPITKTITTGTEEEFITEHYFGYTKQNDNTYEYEVKHPKWKHYPVLEYNIDVDFELNYGSNFKFLNNQEPLSVLLAEGSEIAVENKTHIC